MIRQVTTRWTKTSVFSAKTHRYRSPPQSNRIDLSGANFRRANLSGADLGDAHLSLADLRGAHLSEANLFGADLSGAIATPEQFTEAKNITPEQLAQIKLLESAATQEATAAQPSTTSGPSERKPDQASQEEKDVSG